MNSEFLWKDTQTPQYLGPYCLDRRLGQGGMAQVFLCRRYGASGFKKIYAIKVLLPELRGSGNFERLLIEDARLGSYLQHRNLVHIHDLGMEQDIYYIVMDFVDGVSLKTLLDQAELKDKIQIKIPVPLSLLIILEVVNALEYVHGATNDREQPLGLVHRDISPSNILISRSGEVKLADFGIAKATMVSDITWGKLRKGKYAYMSPEQIAGNPLTPQSDQFGLGVTLFELLTGSLPFEGNSPIETMELVQHQECNISLIPKKLRKLVSRLLKKDPKARFPSEKVLRHGLLSLLRRFSSVDFSDLAELVKNSR